MKFAASIATFFRPCVYVFAVNSILMSAASVASATAYLSDLYPGATVLLSTTKESSTYSGSCVLVRRASDNSTQAIGWSGKNCDVAAFNTFCNATTCWLNTWYDQSGNGNNCVQSTTSRQWQVIVDADGKLSPGTSANGKGCEIADNASYKTAQVHAFVVLNGDNSTDPGSSGEQQPQSIIGYMPTGTADSVARWGVAWYYYDGDGLIHITRNASGANPIKYYAGQAYRRSKTSDFTVWDHATFDQTVNVDVSHALAANLVSAGLPSNGNVTYPTAQVLMIGNNRGYNNSYRGRMRAVVLYGTTRADRQNISAYLRSTISLNFPSIPWTFAKDGFNWTANFLPTWNGDPIDTNGLIWWHEFGGYDWSYAKAATSNNTELVRFEVRPGDDDTIVTGAERSERGAYLGTYGSEINTGSDFEVFAQFKIESGAPQTGDWALTFQIHYDGGASPDIMFLSLLNETFQVWTQRNGSETAQSSAIPFSRNTWYAMRVSGHWSANGTSDTFKVWLGPNGGTLSQITNVSGALFSTDTTGAYVKQGLYRGYPNANAGNLAIQVANHKASLTSGAYASYVATQPNLPTPLSLLMVSPATDVAASGNQGGPFSPSSFQYQLNTASGSVGYSVSGVPSWLTASPSSGTVTTSPTPVTFTVNSSANSLSTGMQNATITFTDTTNNVIVQTMTPMLAINAQQAQQATTTALIASPNPSAFGQSVTFTATVSSASGTPTGTVTFKDGANTLGTGTLSGGVATLSTSLLALGGHTITAVYGGDTNFTGSTSSGLTQTVNQGATTTAVTSSFNPSVFGQSVTFTATVSSASGTPTGTVTFKDGANTLGTGTLSGGVATLSTSSIALGGHTITAVYGGDTNFTGSTSSGLTQTVQGATTTAVTSSFNPAVFGQSVTFTATVSSPSGTPTGTVTFKDGTTTLGTGTFAGGVASFSTAALGVGNHPITAIYSGDSSFAISTSSVLMQVIHQANNAGAPTGSSKRRRRL